MSDRYTTAITGTETATEILESLIELRKSEVAGGMKRTSYLIREFSENQSMDVTGRPVESAHVSLHGRELDAAVQDEQSFLQICLRLEREIGLPMLPKYDPKVIEEKPLATLDEIRAKLDKMRKRLAKHQKDIRAIGADAEGVPVPEVEGAIDALEWLYNNGVGRKFHDIAYQLYRKLVSRERDRLFYIRRHNKQTSLHVCHDEALVEEISTLVWAIKGNPFIKAVMKMPMAGYHGSARF
jgi:hypothetical protein